MHRRAAGLSLSNETALFGTAAANVLLEGEELGDVLQHSRSILAMSVVGEQRKTFALIELFRF
jgi:hypothetical protein